jgi:hypothetical protein
MKKEAINQRFERRAGERNARMRQLLAASEAMTPGWGGMSALWRAMGRSRQVLRCGIKEWQEKRPTSSGRVRRVGGGRKKTVSGDLERLVELVTREDPASEQRWTGKRVRQLAQELQQPGRRVSSQLVRAWLQANRKMREGDEHAERDAQFEHLKARTQAFLVKGEPVISGDARQKELVGEVKRAG